MTELTDGSPDATNASDEKDQVVPVVEVETNQVSIPSEGSTAKALAALEATRLRVEAYARQKEEEAKQFSSFTEDSDDDEEMLEELADLTAAAPPPIPSTRVLRSATVDSFNLAPAPVKIAKPALVRLPPDLKKMKDEWIKKGKYNRPENGSVTGSSSQAGNESDSPDGDERSEDETVWQGLWQEEALLVLVDGIDIAVVEKDLLAELPNTKENGEYTWRRIYLYLTNL